MLISISGSKTKQVALRKLTLGRARSLLNTRCPAYRHAHGQDHLGSCKRKRFSSSFAVRDRSNVCDHLRSVLVLLVQVAATHPLRSEPDAFSKTNAETLRAYSCSHANDCCAALTYRHVYNCHGLLTLLWECGCSR